MNDGIAYIAVHLYNRAQLANPLRNIVNPLSSEILMSKTRTPMRNMRSQFEERRSQPWTSRRSEPQEREPTAQIRSRVASGYMTWGEKHYCCGDGHKFLVRGPLQWRNNLTILGILKGACFFSAATVWSNSVKSTSRTYCIALFRGLIRRCRTWMV